MFFDQPHLILDDVIRNQINVNPVIHDEFERKVPILVNRLLTRMEILLDGDHVSLARLMKSFYNPTCASFRIGWGLREEGELKKVKELVNKQDFHTHNVEDPRILAQALLDFLDGFKEPPISDSTVSCLKKVVDEATSKGNIKLEDVINKERFRLMKVS